MSVGSTQDQLNSFDYSFPDIGVDFENTISPVQDMLATINDTLGSIHETIISLSPGGGGGKDKGSSDPKIGKKESKGITGLFKTIGKGISSALGPIGILVGFLEAMGVLEPLFEIFGSFMEILGVAFLPITEMLIDVFLDLIPVIELIADAISPVIQIIADSFKPILEALLPVFIAILSPVMMIINLLLPLITMFMDLSMAFNPFLTLLPLLIFPFELLGAAISFMTPFLIPVIDFFTGIGDFVSTGINNLRGLFTDFVGNIANWIKEGIEDFDISEVGEAIWGGIKDFFNIFKFKKKK